MSRIRNLKTLATAAGITLVGVVLYIMLAPATWWKPVEIRVELDETPTATAAVEEAPRTAQQASHSGSTRLTAGQGIMYPLDSRVVNLDEPGGLRYLQTSIVLEFAPPAGYYQLEEEQRTAAKEAFQEELDRRRPIIDDRVTIVLSSKGFEDIATVEGKQELKRELMTQINEALEFQKVINVYFAEFVIQ